MAEPVDYQGLREQAGLSASETARRTGYSRTHVSNVESGRTRPSAAYTSAFLAAVSGVDGTEVDDALITPPTSRAKRGVLDTADQIGRVLSGLEGQAKALSILLRSLRAVQEHLEVLAAGISRMPTDFDPSMSSVEDFDVVQTYIVSVMCELLIDHGFWKLGTETIDQYVTQLVVEAAREVKKRRSRMSLPSSSEA